jgi:hypothetical protein
MNIGLFAGVASHVKGDSFLMTRTLKCTGSNPPRTSKLIKSSKKNKSRQDVSIYKFWVENNCFQFWGGKKPQFWGFLFSENFEAQTWVEHAIFALRERRLTTWPLRLADREKTIRKQLWTATALPESIFQIVLTSSQLFEQPYR